MTMYEWDYETVDEHGDVIDHNHRSRLWQFNDADKTDWLVLVRDEGDEANGLENRSWAYVKEGILPKYFQDADNHNTAKVPKRFHEELRRYLSPK